MLAEKSQAARLLTDKLSRAAGKVPFIADRVLSKALISLEENGIPNNRHEDYKYCNVEGILKKEFKSLDADLTEPEDIAQHKLEDAINLVVMNGVFSAELSDKVAVRGMKAGSLDQLGEEEKKLIASAADVESDAFIALNTAFASGGFFISVSDGAAIPMPVHVIYISSTGGEAAVNPRSLVILGDNAELTLVEEQLSGSGKIFGNLLSEKFVGKNSKLETYTIQNEGRGGYSVNTTQVEVDADASYLNTTITLSGQLVRNNHNVVLRGMNSTATLYGLFASGGSQLVDNHTMVDHRVPNCQSNELYKGIVDGKSTGVFNGKIFVRQDAQKTNAYQSSKNILLSDDGSVYAKPQLEIYANDVKCSHGTSTGRIDRDAIFYLNARGIGAESARKMLLASFAGEIIEKIAVESLRDRVSAFFENGFSG
jgi:Fe-S cluster assembly protein SufD